HLELAAFRRRIHCRIAGQSLVHRILRTTRCAQRGIGRYADVAVLVIRKQLTLGFAEGLELMTAVAVAELVGEEQRDAKQFLLRRLILSTQVAIVLRVEGREEARGLEAGDGLCHGAVGARWIIKYVC